MPDNGGWEIILGGRFRRRMRGYERSIERCARPGCMQLLSSGADPARLGDRKYGRYDVLYGYPLSGSIRVLDRVDYDARSIILIAIGDHKEVCGRD